MATRNSPIEIAQAAFRMMGLLAPGEVIRKADFEVLEGHIGPATTPESLVRAISPQFDTSAKYPVHIGTCERCGNPIFEGTEHAPVCEFRFRANLRDQLAMAAPIPIREGDREDVVFAENVARRYRWADAMLKAREK